MKPKKPREEEPPHIKEFPVPRDPKFQHSAEPVKIRPLKIRGLAKSLGAKTPSASDAPRSFNFKPILAEVADLRERFLRTLNAFKPAVLDTLREAPYEEMLKAKWPWLIDGWVLVEHNVNLREVRRAILAWAESWLISGDGWLLDVAVATVSWWRMNPALTGQGWRMPFLVDRRLDAEAEPFTVRTFNRVVEAESDYRRLVEESLNRYLARSRTEAGRELVSRDEHRKRTGDPAEWLIRRRFGGESYYEIAKSYGNEHNQQAIGKAVREIAKQLPLRPDRLLPTGPVAPAPSSQKYVH